MPAFSITNVPTKIFLGVILLIFLFFLYLVTAPQGIYWKDAGEFCLAARFLGIAHPAGSPLYLLMAKLFSLLPLAEFAWRLSLLSALFGALTLFVFFRLSVYLVERRIQNPEFRIQNLVVLFLAAISTGLGASFWHYASVPEVYTLGFFLFFLGFYFFQRWCFEQRANFLATAFLSLGLACSVYIPLIIYLPGFLLVLLFNIRARRSSLASCLLPPLSCFLLGLMIFLYLPIRAEGSPVFNWGNPDNFPRFIAHLTAKQYQEAKLTVPLEFFPLRLSRLLNILPFEFPLVLLLLGVMGFAMNHIRRTDKTTKRQNDKIRIWFIPVYVIVVNIFFTFRYSEWLPHFFIMTFLMLSFLSLLGIVLIPPLKPAFKVERSTLNVFIIFLIGLNLIFLLINGLNFAADRRTRLSQKLSEVILTPLPSGAILVLENGNTVNICLYEQWVREKRTDVLILDPYGTYYSQAKSKGFNALDDYWLSWQWKKSPSFRSGLEQYIKQHLAQRRIFADSIFVINSQLLEKFRLVPISPFIWEIKNSEFITNDEALKDGAKKLRDFFVRTFHEHNLRPASQYNQSLEALVAEVNNTAEVYFQLGLRKEAVNLWRQILLVNRDTMSVLLNLARAYDESRERIQAERLFSEALKKFPDSEEPHYNAGIFYLRHKRYDEAIHEFKTVVKFTPQNEQALKNLCVLLKEEEPALARKYSKQLERIKSH